MRPRSAAAPGSACLARRCGDTPVSRLAGPPPELRFRLIERGAGQPRRHPGQEGGFAGFEPLAEPLGSAKLGAADEVRTPPHLPGHSRPLYLFLEPPQRGTNRLAVPDHDPNTHRCVACTATATPVERAFCGRTSDYPARAITAVVPPGACYHPDTTLLTTISRAGRAGYPGRQTPRRPGPSHPRTTAHASQAPAA